MTDILLSSSARRSTTTTWQSTSACSHTSCQSSADSYADGNECFIVKLLHTSLKIARPDRDTYIVLINDVKG